MNGGGGGKASVFRPPPFVLKDQGWAYPAFGAGASYLGTLTIDHFRCRGRFGRALGCGAGASLSFAGFTTR